MADHASRPAPPPAPTPADERTLLGAPPSVGPATDVRRAAPELPVGGEDDPPATPAERRHVVERLERYARLLDSSVGVPGTSWKVGVESLVGLIPGIGDAAGLALALPILHAARELEIPRGVQLRMLANVGFEALIGTVPLGGDLFDFWWKANQRNVALLRRALERMELERME